MTSWFLRRCYSLRTTSCTPSPTPPAQPQRTISKLTVQQSRVFVVLRSNFTPIALPDCASILEKHPSWRSSQPSAAFPTSSDRQGARQDDPDTIESRANSFCAFLEPLERRSTFVKHNVPVLFQDLQMRTPLGGRAPLLHDIHEHRTVLSG